MLTLECSAVLRVNGSLTIDYFNRHSLDWIQNLESCILNLSDPLQKGQGRYNIQHTSIMTSCSLWNCVLQLLHKKQALTLPQRHPGISYRRTGQVPAAGWSLKLQGSCLWSQPPPPIYPPVFPVPHHELHHSGNPHIFFQHGSSHDHFLTQPGENASDSFRLLWKCSSKPNHFELALLRGWLCRQLYQMSREKLLANRWVHLVHWECKILIPLWLQIPQDMWHSSICLSTNSHRLRFLCLIEFFSWGFVKTFWVLSRAVIVNNNIYTGVWTFHTHCSCLPSKMLQGLRRKMQQHKNC